LLSYHNTTTSHKRKDRGGVQILSPAPVSIGEVHRLKNTCIWAS
jgi:uncharacterized membrane protein